MAKELEVSFTTPLNANDRALSIPSTAPTTWIESSTCGRTPPFGAFGRSQLATVNSTAAVTGNPGDDLRCARIVAQRGMGLTNTAINLASLTGNATDHIRALLIS